MDLIEPVLGDPDGIGTVFLKPLARGLPDH
jgi:hypothetical protein